MTRTKEENKIYMKAYRKRKKEEAKQIVQLREGLDKSRLQELRQLVNMSGKITEAELEEKERLETLYNPEYYMYEDDRDFYKGLDKDARQLSLIKQLINPPSERQLSREAKEAVNKGISGLAFGKDSKKTAYVDIRGDPVVEVEKGDKKKPWGKIVYDRD